MPCDHDGPMNYPIQKGHVIREANKGNNKKTPNNLTKGTSKLIII
jgi:hypothetical protein